MLGKSPNQNQKSFFKPLLKDFIDMNHPLVLLSERIPWKALEKDFANLYSCTGTPSKPLRLMVGLLILKQMFNLGDETLIPQWIQNPYFQYFCGEAAPSKGAGTRDLVGRQRFAHLGRVSVGVTSP